jgi:hypothetical protein
MAYEIDDEDARLLATVKKLGGMPALDQMYRAHTLHSTLHADPNVRTHYERLIKHKYPATQTTDDMAAPYVKRIDETDSRIKALEESLAKEKEENLAARRQSDFNGQWDQAVKDHDMTAEGEEALAKFMKDRSLQDPESAALLYFKHNPKPASPQDGGGLMPKTWGIGPLPGEDPESSKMLMENPERWADQEAANVINEMRSAR